MGFESIIEKIQSLPPLPQTVLKLEEAFRNNEPNMKTIVAIIEGDPLLTADILAKVNAPMYGLRNRIVSVMQAVTLFGLGTVRGLALKASIERNFEIDVSPYGISSIEFAKISAMQNALMFQWYMGINVERAKILIPLAFLMETGKVIIAKELTDSSYAQMFQDELFRSSSIGEIEEMFAGTTSEHVSAMLFRHWHFEEIFAILMESINQPEELENSIQEMAIALKAVQTAVNVKVQLSDESIEKGGQIAASMGYEPSRFVNTARRIHEKFL